MSGAAPFRGVLSGAGATSCARLRSFPRQPCLSSAIMRGMHRRLLCALLLQLFALALAGEPNVRVLLGSAEPPLEFVVPGGHQGDVDSHVFSTPGELTWPL